MKWKGRSFFPPFVFQPSVIDIYDGVRSPLWFKVGSMLSNCKTWVGETCNMKLFNLKECSRNRLRVTRENDAVDYRVELKNRLQ